MKNCLILGFGRSGTSLMGGILHTSGYFMGGNLYPPRDTNPMGFFENSEVNGINERILEKFDAVKLGDPGPFSEDSLSPYHPGFGHRWLSYIPPGTLPGNDDEGIGQAINKAVSVGPFAYKDPRFNYTLKTWNKYLNEDTVFLCMFRQPDIVVNSVLKECQTAEYLSGFKIDKKLAYQLWLNNYTNVLDHLYPLFGQRILFIHYEQLLNKSRLPVLSGFLGTELDESFIRLSLNRSVPAGDMPPAVVEIYQRLCNLSGYLG